MEKKSLFFKPHLNVCAFAALTLISFGTNAATDLYSYKEMFQPLIFGGRTAAPGQFPYQVLLNMNAYGMSTTCGGSIISRYYILTAAHCIEAFVDNPEDISVRAGSVMYNEGGVIKGVTEVIVHPQYRAFSNDIAILKLDSPLKYGKTIQNIRLGKKQVPDGEPVIISGWGLLPFGILPEQLQYNIEYAISHEECAMQIGDLSQSMRCFEKRAGNGMCSGDSGGPAIYGRHLIGVASFMVNGCGSNLPDVYTDVISKRNWILEHIKSQTF